jgi:hypothetical protein
MDAQAKARENRVRRYAQRQRYVLVKSKVRDHRAWQHGRYWLVPEDPGAAVIGAGNGISGSPPGLTLDEAEQELGTITWRN